MHYEVWYGKGERPVHLADQRVERTGRLGEILNGYQIEYRLQSVETARHVMARFSSYSPEYWTRIVRVDNDGRCTGL